jgi:biotin carboxylase
MPRVAIVDPWSGGALLAPELRRRGCECLAVHSAPDLAAALGLATRREDFAEVLEHEGSLDAIDPLPATIARLRERGVDLVLAGCETGVLLADRLAAALGLPGNGLARSAARRDKTLMARAAAEKGLAVPRQASSADVDGLLAWIDRECGYPVVVKPARSLDSDGVAPCADPGQVRAACAAILGRRNRAGLIEDEVVVQELLAGDQYAVDTVSRDGRHLLAGIWSYSRPQRRPAASGLRNAAPDLPPYAAIGSDGKRMVPATDDRARPLFDFASRVLDALDIRWGPGHCEILWTDRGPELVEIGARLHGGEKTPLVSRLSTGSSQLDRTVEAWLDPPRFGAALGRPYELTHHGAMVYLMPWRTGTLQGYGRLRELTRLPSFLEIYNLAAPGPLTRRVLGVVILIHADPELLQGDVDRIRAWERDGLYQIEPAPLLASPLLQPPPPQGGGTRSTVPEGERTSSVLNSESNGSKCSRPPRPPWAIGIYAGSSPLDLLPAAGIANPVLTSRDIHDLPAAFVADPFLLRRQDRWHLFFEILREDTGRGEIGWAESPDGRRFTYRETVLREPYHLSYPYVFEHDGEIYMTPETLDAGAVRLYRAAAFPRSWELVTSLLAGRLADPTPIHHDGHWYLFACATPKTHDTLCLFHAESLTGPWREHPASPLIHKDRRASRPAGRPLFHDGAWLRFAQDCDPVYGSRIRAFRITDLTPTTYAERLYHPDPFLSPTPAGWNATRTHHLDLQLDLESGWLACLDGC